MNKPDFVNNIELICIEKYIKTNKQGNKITNITRFNKNIIDYNIWEEFDVYDITGEKFKSLCFCSEFTDCEILYNQLDVIRKNLPKKYIDIIPLDYELFPNIILENNFSFEEFKNDILDYYPVESIDYVLVTHSTICIFWKIPQEIVHPNDWNDYKIYAINRNADISELYKTN